ncbi:Phage-related protein [Serinicoccus hydrothermalis]|uniref:Phage-related protein n=1 Tax=Serinicoccus hydrothermalis TaxID=1758689 RepID=A0A1B1NCC8_9MICO|nr:SprT-like domain-containing protein [Serinicoccus hydrothermalis]ANS79082.1 Phage-related protein [Serinicoccus hydrothermalis]
MDLEEAGRLARRLMGEHGLRDWAFGFDRAKVRAGACHWQDRRITLSRQITAAHEVAQVRETLLHEIAHALVGPAHGHDAVWRARARQIGSTGDRCYVADVPVVAGRWQGRCSAGHVVQRHRRPTRVLVCTRCRGMPTLDRVLSWSHDGRPVDHAELGPTVRETMRELRRLT